MNIYLYLLENCLMESRHTSGIELLFEPRMLSLMHFVNFYVCASVLKLLAMSLNQINYSVVLHEILALCHVRDRKWECYLN